MIDFDRSKIDKAIELLIEWADSKLVSGSEPPWTKPQYEALSVTLSAIRNSRSSVIFLEDLQQSGEYQGTFLPLSENIVHLDTFRLRPFRVPVCMPM